MLWLPLLVPGQTLTTMNNWQARWQALWNPSQYHGWGRTRNYFEGWYYKIVSPCERHALALIPGIAMDPQGKAEAFLQVLDGKACTSAYHAYPAAAFAPSAGRFEVELGPHRFWESGLQLGLPQLEGALSFSGLASWPSRLWSPGIMGWYTFVPFMECYHGVVSMGHRLEGVLKIKGEEVDFTGGRGYVEKDWGRSFPSSWVWMQSNHFDGQEGTSFMASVARIPWLGTHFPGYLAGWHWEGRIFPFTTYNGAKLALEVDTEHKTVQLDFSRKNYRLSITAHQRGGQGALAAPVSGAMAGKVSESLQSELKAAFFKGGECLYQGVGRHAGLEVAGNVIGELSTVLGGGS